MEGLAAAALLQVARVVVLMVVLEAGPEAALGFALGSWQLPQALGEAVLLLLLAMAAQVSASRTRTLERVE